MPSNKARSKAKAAQDENAASPQRQQQQQQPGLSSSGSPPRQALQAITPTRSSSSSSDHSTSPISPSLSNVPTAVSGSIFGGGSRNNNTTSLFGDSVSDIIPVLTRRRSPDADGDGDSGEDDLQRQQRRQIKSKGARKCGIDVDEATLGYPQDGAKRRASATQPHPTPPPVPGTTQHAIVGKRFKVSLRIFLSEHVLTPSIASITVGETIEFTLGDVFGFVEHQLEGRSLEPELRFDSPMLTLTGQTSFRFCPLVCGDIKVHCSIYGDVTPCTIHVVSEDVMNNKADVSTSATATTRKKASRGGASVIEIDHKALLAGHLSPRPRAPSPISRQPRISSQVVTSPLSGPGLPMPPRSFGRSLVDINNEAAVPAITAVGLGLVRRFEHGSSADSSQSDSSFYDSDDIISEPDSSPPRNNKPSPSIAVTTTTTTAVTTTVTSATISISTSTTTSAATTNVSSASNENALPSTFFESQPGDCIVTYGKFDFSPDKLVFKKPTRVLFICSADADTNFHNLTCHHLGPPVVRTSSSHLAAASILSERARLPAANAEDCRPPVLIERRARPDGSLVGVYFFDQPGEYDVSDEVFNYMKCRVTLLPAVEPIAPSLSLPPSLTLPGDENPEAVGSASKKSKAKKQAAAAAAAATDEGTDEQSVVVVEEKGNQDSASDTAMPSLSLALPPREPSETVAALLSSPIIKQQHLRVSADYSEELDLDADGEEDDDPPPYVGADDTEIEQEDEALPPPPSYETTIEGASAPSTKAINKKKKRKEALERREREEKERLAVDKEKERAAEALARAEAAERLAKEEREKEERDLEMALQMSLCTAAQEEKERLEREEQQKAASEKVAAKEKREKEEKEKKAAEKAKEKAKKPEAKKQSSNAVLPATPTPPPRPASTAKPTSPPVTAAPVPSLVPAPALVPSTPPPAEAVSKAAAVLPIAIAPAAVPTSSTPVLWRLKVRGFDSQTLVLAAVLPSSTVCELRNLIASSLEPPCEADCIRLVRAATSTSTEGGAPTSASAKRIIFGRSSDDRTIESCGIVNNDVLTVERARSASSTASQASSAPKAVDSFPAPAPATAPPPTAAAAAPVADTAALASAPLQRPAEATPSKREKKRDSLAKKEAKKEKGSSPPPHLEQQQAQQQQQQQAQRNELAKKEGASPALVDVPVAPEAPSVGRESGSVEVEVACLPEEGEGYAEEEELWPEEEGEEADDTAQVQIDSPWWVAEPRADELGARIRNMEDFFLRRWQSLCYKMMDDGKDVLPKGRRVPIANYQPSSGLTLK